MNLYMLLVLFLSSKLMSGTNVICWRLFNARVKFLDGMQNFIPNMWQVVHVGY